VCRQTPKDFPIATQSAHKRDAINAAAVGVLIGAIESCAQILGARVLVAEVQCPPANFLVVCGHIRRQLYDTTRCVRLLCAGLCGRLPVWWRLGLHVRVIDVYIVSIARHQHADLLDIVTPIIIIIIIVLLTMCTHTPVEDADDDVVRQQQQAVIYIGLLLHFSTMMDDKEMLGWM
jgi:hypothetical protein